MKVYIVVGYVRYEGEEIVRVFGRREDAESFMDSGEHHSGFGSYVDGYRIEEKEVE